MYVCVHIYIYICVCVCVSVSGYYRFLFFYSVQVADFGLARVVSGKDVMKTACGTPGYVAPEILKNQGYDSGAVDIWSVRL